MRCTCVNLNERRSSNEINGKNVRIRRILRAICIKKSWMWHDKNTINATEWTKKNGTIRYCTVATGIFIVFFWFEIFLALHWVRAILSQYKLILLWFKLSTLYKYHLQFRVKFNKLSFLKGISLCFSSLLIFTMPQCRPNRFFCALLWFSIDSETTIGHICDDSFAEYRTLRSLWTESDQNINQIKSMSIEDCLLQR